MLVSFTNLPSPSSYISAVIAALLSLARGDTPNTIEDAIVLTPIIVLVIIALYAVSTILNGVLKLEDCVEAAGEIERQVRFCDGLGRR